MPTNRDEILAEMKEALFVRVPMKPRPIVAPLVVTMDQLDYESTMGEIIHGGERRPALTRDKRETSVECLRILNNAIVVARR